MSDLPRHREVDDPDAARLDTSAGSSTPWGTYVFAAIVVLLVLTIVALHAAGIMGPGAH